MRQNLKMSTALVAVLSLVAPSGVTAQQAAETGTDTVLTCAPGFEALCADLEALEAEREQIRAASETAGEDAAAGAMAEVDARIEEIREQIEEAREEAGMDADESGSEGGAKQAQPAQPIGGTTGGAIEAQPTISDNAASTDAPQTGGTVPAEMGASAGASGGDTDSGSTAGASADANADASGNDNTGAGADTGSDAGADTGAAASSDTGADAGTDTGSSSDGGAIEAQPAQPTGDAPGGAIEAQPSTSSTEAAPATGTAGAQAEPQSGETTQSGDMTGTSNGDAATTGNNAATGGAIEAQPAQPTGDAPGGAMEAEPATGGDASAQTGTDANAAGADAGASAATDGQATSQTSAGAEKPAIEAKPAQPAADAPGGATEAQPATSQGAIDAASGTQAPVAAMAADGAAAGDEPTVERETVTEENSRSSAEDFDTKIAREAQPAEDGAAAAKKDDGGLSTLEKALLAGAGAIAVGSLLSGNREIVARSDDRVVVSRNDGSFQLIKDDDTLLRRPGAEVETQTFSDGSTRTVVTREDGSQIITVRDPELRVLRRVRVDTDGRETVLIDDTLSAEPVDVSRLPEPRSMQPASIEVTDRDALRAALEQQGAMDRTFSLAQVRNISEVRTLAPAVDLNNITFASGSAAIPPAQAEELVAIGEYIRGLVEQNPSEVVLIEGHTDAVGDAAYNLALSDRRAESVALALTEYFDVPPENLVVQGYGEQFLRVPTETAEQANRRATVRRITPLLREVASAN